MMVVNLVAFILRGFVYEKFT
ncbi:hypothetical protein EMIT0324P_20025 [Pseudomonas chlororaphis]